MTSYVRRALDQLLELHPNWDLVEYEWQADGPWVLVVLGQPSNGDKEAWARHPYAIWKNTGSVYGMREGAVNDDPFLTLQR
jgi:hypothetical protein